MNGDDTAYAQQDPPPIRLPRPQQDGGQTTWLSLRERKTTRDMREERLPPQVLSNLLWAAFGVNRVDGPMGRTGRTAPSGLNLQSVDIYVALPEGVFLYEANPHRLSPVVARDIRQPAVLENGRLAVRLAKAAVNAAARGAGDHMNLIESLAQAILFDDEEKLARMRAFLDRKKPG